MSNKKSVLSTSGPKVLIFDIETSPILGFVWSIWEQNVALNQIDTDWHVLSWAAKWLDAPADEIMYMDQRNAKNIEDDSKLLEGIWKLLDEADVVITQNGKNFDQRKLNARFVINGFQPPSSYKHIDTKILAQKHFGFTSHKLEYMADKLCVKYKKSDHSKFSGFELWKECLAGNKEAWKVMEEYNKYDVLSLEELYNVLIPWDNSVNFNLYTDSIINACKCGSVKFKKHGFAYTQVGKFQRYKCLKCGSEMRDRVNLFTKEKKDSLQVNTVR
jgi:DNA polymerase elongation subunit (family B)